MIKKILIGFVLGVLVLVVVVAMQPGTYAVERSTSIMAPQSVVFSQVNDFHNWEAWSPWAKLDPNSKATFEGAPSGKNAVFRWAGNDKVGEGSMTILESTPSDLVKINLEFIKPFASTALTEFTFKPSEGKTLVTWRMSGDKNFMSKAFCMFQSMDKMIGGDFEKGLASMKTVAESPVDKAKVGTTLEAEIPKK